MTAKILIFQGVNSEPRQFPFLALHTGDHLRPLEGSYWGASWVLLGGPSIVLLGALKRVGDINNNNKNNNMINHYDDCLVIYCPRVGTPSSRQTLPVR